MWLDITSEIILVHATCHHKAFSSQRVLRLQTIKYILIRRSYLEAGVCGVQREERTAVV